MPLLITSSNNRCNFLIIESAYNDLKNRLLSFVLLFKVNKKDMKLF